MSFFHSAVVLGKNNSLPVSLAMETAWQIGGLYRDWENRVKQVPDAVLYPVERQTATVRFDGMVFGCSDVQRHGNRWIAVGTQSRTYTNRGRNLGAFVLDRYSPNYEGTYTPTVGVYEWIGAGERITPSMRQAIATRVAKL